MTNRAERRARIFLRQPKAKELAAPAPSPERLASGIRPILDDLDRLLLGQAFTEVPQAALDGDLTAPTPFIPQEINYLVRFGRQICVCGAKSAIFLGLYEERNGVQHDIPRVPVGVVPSPQFSERPAFIPFCPECVKQ